MKLPDFYKFEALNRAKERMGIPRDVYGSLSLEVEPGRLTADELNLLSSGGGIDIHFNELTVLPDGTLAYKDTRVLLHIRDINVVSNDQERPKYHVYNCSTLVSMNASGRFDRYVISTTVDGVFSIRIINNNRPRPERAKLDVCKNCLNELHLNGFDSQKMKKKEKARFVADFTPSKFFELYPQSLFTKKPVYDSDTAPSNVYTADWDQISTKMRSDAAWRCQLCKADLSAANLHRYLQTHHKNGHRYDNRPENLIALCIECHAAQPNHHHIRNSPDYILFKSLTSLARR